MSFVCSTCNDTHWMSNEVRSFPCTRCPKPCAACASRLGPYCVETPSACACHAARAQAAPGDAEPAPKKLIGKAMLAWAETLTDEQGIKADSLPLDRLMDAFLEIATLDMQAAQALRAKNAQLVHVLKQLREAYGLLVPAFLASYIKAEPLRDSKLAIKTLHGVEKVGREIDDALIAFADDVAVKERAELQRQLAEARAAAEVQADALAEQAADMERLRRRLDIEFEKTRAMTRALGEVWEQVPDEDRIGKSADQWVRGLGRRVRARELTAAARPSKAIVNELVAAIRCRHTKLCVTAQQALAAYDAAKDERTV